MNEIMAYIFGTLEKNEASISKLTRAVNKQASNLTLLVIAGVGYIYLTERKRKEQDKKIKQLREELEALTNNVVEDDVVKEP